MTHHLLNAPRHEATLAALVSVYGREIDASYARRTRLEDALAAAIAVHDSAFCLEGAALDAELALTGAAVEAADLALAAEDWLLTGLLAKQAELDDLLDEMIRARQRAEFAEDCRRVLAGPFYQACDEAGMVPLDENWQPIDVGELRYSDAACD